MIQLYTIDRYEYKPGQPFRVMPVGTFKRGDRTLNITPERLQQMANNYASNRPRWKIPLYPGHPTEGNQDPPKIGNIKSLFVKPDGLYADPEWTAEGEKLVKDGGYQFVSPGVLWSLNGNEYTDEKGDKYDNVIDHVALTNRPFFGEKTQLFSADAEVEKMADAENKKSKPSIFAKFKSAMKEMMDYMDYLDANEPDADETAPGGGSQNDSDADEKMAFTLTAEGFKDYDTATRQAFAKKGWALPNGSYPIADKGDLIDAIHRLGSGNAPEATIKAHIIKRARALGATDELPADWEGSTKKPDNAAQNSIGGENMAEPNAGPAIKPEEFAALKAKADQFDALKAQVDTLAAQAKTSADQFAAEKRARRSDQLSVRYAGFGALPVKTEEFAAKMLTLEEVNADLFKYFDGLISTMNATIEKSALFDTFSVARSGGAADTFEAAVEIELTKNFGGDRAKYSDAMNKVASERPELYAEYKNSYSARSKEA